MSKKLRLWDCKNNQFVTNVNLAEIMRDENWGAWLRNKQMENCIVVEIDSEMDFEMQLRCYRDMEKSIAELKRELEKELNDRTAIKAANNDGMPHGTGTGDPVLSKTQKLLDQDGRIRLIKCQLGKVSNDKLIIEIMLGLLTQEERQIITEYYINGFNWATVEKKTNYCIKECQRKRDSSMKKMEVFLK